MKKLVIEVQEVFGKKVLHIMEQTCRCRDFGLSGSTRFRADNNFLLYSEENPEWSMGDSLHVRGSETHLDDTLIIVPSEEWLARLRIAVKQYNQEFGVKKSEPKPGYEVIE